MERWGLLSKQSELGLYSWSFKHVVSLRLDAEPINPNPRKDFDRVDGAEPGNRSKGEGEPRLYSWSHEAVVGI